jgi:NitT/TauT family transport system substrate-binding protein
MHVMQSRRRFLETLSSASAAALLGSLPLPAFATEAPPETTTVRLGKVPGICIAPQYVAEELLQVEGFTDIRYVPTGSGTQMAEATARGDVDFGLNFAASIIPTIDAGEPITVLAGVHVGCFELFASDGIRSITDLKRKKVGVQALDSSQHAFLTAMAAYVGLDPVKDIDWITSSTIKPMELFVDGKVDAFLGFPPEPQELRARQIGHVVVNSALDRPWSQYFCCMLAGNADYVRENPAASRRVLRAILKAAELCAAEPQRAAQRIVEGGFTARYDYALQTLNEIAYRAWRDYDPEDTLRFYALRLHEAGVIKSSPKKIIADGSDWHFLNELKAELKA